MSTATKVTFRPTATSITKNFNTLGSFWTEQMSDKGREHAKIISSLSLYDNGPLYVQNAKNNILNKPDRAYTIEESFKFDKVYASNTNNPFPSDPSKNDAYATYTESISAKRVAIHVPTGVDILLIQTESDEKPILYAGIDFLQNTYGYIYFKGEGNNEINIWDYFPNKEFRYSGICKTISLKGQSIFRSLLGVTDIGIGDKELNVADYVNGISQSAKDFELMLNSVADCCIVPRSHKYSKLITYVPGGGACYYVFKDLNTGRTYTIAQDYEPTVSLYEDQSKSIFHAKDIINTAIRCFYRKNKDDYWWYGAKTIEENPRDFIANLSNYAVHPNTLTTTEFSQIDANTVTLYSSNVNNPYIPDGFITTLKQQCIIKGSQTPPSTATVFKMCAFDTNSYSLVNNTYAYVCLRYDELVGDFVFDIVTETEWNNMAITPEGNQLNNVLAIKASIYDSSASGYIILRSLGNDEYTLEYITAAEYNSNIGNQAALSPTIAEVELYATIVTASNPSNEGKLYPNSSAPEQIGIKLVEEDGNLVSADLSREAVTMYDIEAPENGNQIDFILRYAVPSALVVCFEIDILYIMYDRRASASLYFKNKYPTFQAYINSFINLIRKSAPLGYTVMFTATRPNQPMFDYIAWKCGKIHLPGE